jgi:hypothetical protein
VTRRCTSDGRRPRWATSAWSPGWLARATATLRGEQVHALTDVVGAERLELRDGIARLTMGKADRLHLPQVRIAEGARMPAKIEVSGARIDEERRFVHVSQRSGGRIVGGVTLELRPPAEGAAHRRAGRRG